MQQGSEVSNIPPKHPVEASRTLAIQKQRVIAVKEVSSLLNTMQYMALYCIDQNHVTLDHMETMANTLSILQRQVEALHLELASH